MGILAYCQSFKKICEESLGKGSLGLPEFNDDALLLSLKARADERVAQANDRATDALLRISRAANVRLFALTFVLILTAILVMFVQPYIEHGSSPKLQVISRFAIDNLFSIFATLILVLIFIWALTQSDWQVKRQIGRDVLELSNVRRIMFAIIYTIAGLIVLLITFFLGEPAVADIARMISTFWRVISGP